MITGVTSISLYRQNLNLQSLESVELEGNVGLSVGIFIDDYSYNEKRKLHKILVGFQILLSENEEELFSVKHRLSLIGDARFDGIGNNQEIDYKIFEIIEPYIRERLYDSFEHTDVPIPKLPYRFWENLEPQD